MTAAQARSTVPAIVTVADARSWHWAEALCLAYLGIPLFMFFAGFVRLELAIPACALLAFFGWEIARRTSWQELLNLRLEHAYFLALAMVWVWLSGGIGPLHQNGDWYKHYGILNFLSQHPWPAAGHVAGLGDAAVRYYIGWYLVPAALLKLIHLPVQTLALSAWSVVGVFLFFNLLPGLVGRRWAIVFAPLVFMFFSGADFFGTLVTGYEHPVPYHFEWWARWGQFSATTTALFWVPQHALAAWLGAALLMRLRGREPLLPYVTLLGSAVLLWSPFSAIGLLPFVAALLIQHGFRKLVLDGRAIVSLLLLAAPLGLYLTAGASDIPHGYVAVVSCGWVAEKCFSWPSYLLFLLIEIGVPVCILLFRREREHGFLIAAAAALCLIPLYQIGLANDFAMRASLPSIAVVAILCSKALVPGSKLVSVAMLCVLLAGLPTVAGEIARAFLPGEDIPADHALSDDHEGAVLAQYFAPQPIWVLR